MGRYARSGRDWRPPAAATQNEEALQAPASKISEIRQLKQGKSRVIGTARYCSYKKEAEIPVCLRAQRQPLEGRVRTWRQPS